MPQNFFTSVFLTSRSKSWTEQELLVLRPLTHWASVTLDRRCNDWWSGLSLSWCFSSSLWIRSSSLTPNRENHDFMLLLRLKVKGTVLCRFDSTQERLDSTFTETWTTKNKQTPKLQTEVLMYSCSLWENEEVFVDIIKPQRAAEVWSLK